MGRNKSCFSLVNRLCLSEPQPKTKKESKKRRWVFRRLKLKRRPTAEVAVAQKGLSEATEEQRKHAVVVAIATAAAAEAAVAAANAAAETVRRTCFHQSSDQYGKGTRNVAAIKIQTAYRAHLARKAKKALKGVVALQAIIRGQIVRRRLITKPKYLPSITNTSLQVRQMTAPNANQNSKDVQKKHLPNSKNSSEAKEIQLAYNSRRCSNYNFSSREDVKASRKQEAIIKKDPMKRYYVSHSEKRNDASPKEPKVSKESGRKSYALEEWGNAEIHKRREAEKLKLTVHSKSSTASDTYGLRNAQKHDSVENPRRSSLRHHTKQKSIGNETSLPNSPVLPTYRVGTQSAKAKAEARSMSTPKQRLEYHLHTLSSHTSPQRSRPSSFNGKVTGSTNGKSGTSH